MKGLKVLNELACRERKKIKQRGLARQRDKEDDERRNDRVQRNKNDHLCSTLETRVKRRYSFLPFTISLSLSLPVSLFERLVDIVSCIDEEKC